MFLAAGAIALLAAGLSLYVHRAPPDASPASAPPAPAAAADPPRPTRLPGTAPASRASAASPFAVATPGRPPDLVERVQREAADAVERQRPELVRRCFPGGADPSEFRLHLAFDASGREVARSVVATRRGEQRAVNCLTRLPDAPVAVEGTGAPSSAVVAVRLP